MAPGVETCREEKINGNLLSKSQLLPAEVGETDQIRFQRREEGVSARESYFYRRRLDRVCEICQLFTVPILQDKSQARFAKKDQG